MEVDKHWSGPNPRLSLMSTLQCPGSYQGLSLVNEWHQSYLIDQSGVTGLSVNVCPSQLSINPRCFDVPGKGFLNKFQSPPVSPLVKSAPSLPSTPTSPCSPVSPGWSSPSPGARSTKTQSPFARFRQLEDSSAQGPGSGSR